MSPKDAGDIEVRENHYYEKARSQGIPTNEEKIKEAKIRAEEILKNQTDEKSTALASATLARSLLELNLVQKRKIKR